MILGVGLGDANDPGFTHFGEETEPRRRAELLDEGLDVIAGLRTGNPVQLQGDARRPLGGHDPRRRAHDQEHRGSETVRGRLGGRASHDD